MNINKRKRNFQRDDDDSSCSVSLSSSQDRPPMMNITQVQGMDDNSSSSSDESSCADKSNSDCSEKTNNLDDSRLPRRSSQIINQFAVSSASSTNGSSHYSKKKPFFKIIGSDQNQSSDIKNQSILSHPTQGLMNQNSIQNDYSKNFQKIGVNQQQAKSPESQQFRSNFSKDFYNMFSAGQKYNSETNNNSHLYFNTSNFKDQTFNSSKSSIETHYSIVRSLQTDQQFQLLVLQYPTIKTETIAVFYMRNDCNTEGTKVDIYNQLGVKQRDLKTLNKCGEYQARTLIRETLYKKLGRMNSEEIKLEDREYGIRNGEDSFRSQNFLQKATKALSRKDQKPPLPTKQNLEQIDEFQYKGKKNKTENRKQEQEEEKKEKKTLAYVRPQTGTVRTVREASQQFKKKANTQKNSVDLGRKKQEQNEEIKVAKEIKRPQNKAKPHEKVSFFKRFF